MLENPTFPQEALDRLQARTIVGLTQKRDRTTGIASVVFPKVAYSTNHPYGRSMLESSVKAITRDDLVAFHKSYYQPGRAVITVVGDVKPDEIKRTIEQALTGWKAGGSMPTFDYPAAPSAKSTTIYLVDKPAAAQSTFTIGSVGPPRSTPDYYAIRVMNEMLGALFQSRLNHNIREVKGYSYGVNSSFAFGRGPGPFRAGGDIVTAKTDSALIEFVKELPRSPLGKLLKRELRKGPVEEPVREVPATVAAHEVVPQRRASDAKPVGTNGNGNGNGNGHDAKPASGLKSDNGSAPAKEVA